MRNLLAITKALSDENRVRALMALAGGELCVCQIIELLALAPSTVSKHMAVLHQAGLVQTRKDGRWVYYRLAGREASPGVQGALRWVQRTLASEPRVAADRRLLVKVQKRPREELSACCYKA